MQSIEVRIGAHVFVVVVSGVVVEFEKFDGACEVLGAFFG